MNHRNHRSGGSLTWMVLAAVLLAAPVAASADHDERRRGTEASRRDAGHRGGERVDARHRDHRRYDAFRGDHRVSRHARHHRHHRHDRHDRHADRRVDSQRHRHGAPFYCRPCRDRFHSKLGFRRHLHRHHHVAPWRASRRIVHDAFGWIFFG